MSPLHGSFQLEALDAPVRNFYFFYYLQKLLDKISQGWVLDLE